MREKSNAPFSHRQGEAGALGWYGGPRREVLPRGATKPGISGGAGQHQLLIIPASHPQIARDGLLPFQIHVLTHQLNDEQEGAEPVEDSMHDHRRQEASRLLVKAAENQREHEQGDGRRPLRAV